MRPIVFVVFLFLTSISYSQNFTKLDESFRINQLRPPTEKVRMVLDTDTYNEVDDQFALAYAYLSEDKIQLEAVYAAPFKNNRSESAGDGMEKSYMEIRKLLKMLDKSPERFAFRGSDNYLEDSSKPNRSEAALDLVKKALASSPENPLYIVPVGCITNVASAILIEWEIIKSIVVVWLGGNNLNWPNQREFNLRQDVLAAQGILNSEVPFAIMPCNPVVTVFRTTILELEFYLKGKNELSDYLFNIVVEYSKSSIAWSKVIWDITAVAWLVNSSWIPTNLVHSPILTDQLTYSVDQSRHFIHMASSLNRDAIFKDLFDELTY